MNVPVRWFGIKHSISAVIVIFEANVHVNGAITRVQAQGFCCKERSFDTSMASV